MKRITFVQLSILLLMSCTSLISKQQQISKNNTASTNDKLINNHKPVLETNVAKKSNYQSKESLESNHDKTSAKPQEPTKPPTHSIVEVTTQPINNHPIAKMPFPKIQPEPTPQAEIEDPVHDNIHIDPVVPPALSEAQQLPEPEPKLECSNDLYDVNQSCDWIHPNLRPVDELGREVPSFMNSQEAWGWGEAQIMESTSTWYLCGFNRMDGETNNGTPFYYTYMKSCLTE